MRFILLLFSTLAFGMSDTPSIPLVPDDVLSGCTRKDTNHYEITTCWAGGEYIPPSWANSDAVEKHPITIVKRKLSGKKRLVSISPGHAPTPTACESPDLSTPIDAVGVFICPGHYPDQSLWGAAPDYGINFYDGNYERRFRLAVLKAISLYRDDLDLGAGILRAGTSMGANRSLALMLNMEQELESERRFVSGIATHYHLRVGVTQPHLLGDNPLIVPQLGDYDLNRVNFDFVAMTGKLNNKYLRIECDTGDRTPYCDPAIFEQADRHGIAVLGTWHGCGTHSVNCEGYNFPYGNLYPNGGSEHRLDQPYVAFSGASSNHYGESGHHNLGLRYDVDSIWALDTALLASVLVMYERHDLGPNLPPMPPSSTVSVVIRKLKDFALTAGESVNWQLRNTEVFQSGTAQVMESGEIWIHDLVLPDGVGLAVVLTKGDNVPPPEPPVVDPIPDPKPVWELVYVESDRTVTNGRDYSLWDHGLGVGRIDGDIQESDIIIEDQKGIQKALTNCRTSNKICMNEDPRVSPDGNKILWWEGIGDELVDVYAVGIKTKTGGKDIKNLIECKLWVHELDGESYPISSGSCDRTPDWIDNDTVVFTSNRAKEYVPLTCPGKVNPVQGMQYKLGYQLYRADIVNRQLANIERLTPHHANVLSPEVTSNGRILPSVHNAGERTCFNTSPKNAWYVANMDTNGADQTSAEFAFHGYPSMKTYELVPTVDPARRGILASPKAFRVVTEIDNNLFCGNEYYRNNHRGSNGILHCWEYNNNEGVLTMRELDSAYQWATGTAEGSGQFTPSSHYIATPFAESQDALVRFDLQGRAMGKVGASFAHTDGYFGFVWNRGMGYTHAIDVTIRPDKPEGIDFTDPINLGGEPPSQGVIALALVPVVTDPFNPEQVKILSAHPDKHRYAPAQIRPYQDHFGQDAPEQAPRLTPGKTVLRAQNAHEHQVFPIPRKTSKAQRAAIQGNLDEGTITKACITYTDPHKTQPQVFDLNYAEKICTSVSENGKYEFEVIPDKPFEMSWEGVTGELGRDHSLHSLRNGETRCCVGCHLHSEDSPTECEQ